jgi:phosphopantetheinyl transferase
MPYMLEINPWEDIRAGIWKIEESADDLLTALDLTSTEVSIYNSFRHELRKKQWLAYRILLKQLLAPNPVNIYYDLNGKPFLNSASHQISVSHAGKFAAAVYSKKNAVGIDIEVMRDRVVRVQHRFLQENELDSLCADNLIEHLYVFWGGKEALYKLHGTPEVDFRNDIHIQPFDYLCNTNQHCNATVNINGRVENHSLFYQKVEECMVVVAS